VMCGTVAGPMLRKASWFLSTPAASLAMPTS
jgi:hypothetical protein